MTGVQTCALPICVVGAARERSCAGRGERTNWQTVVERFDRDVRRYAHGRGERRLVAVELHAALRLGHRAHARRMRDCAVDAAARQSPARIGLQVSRRVRAGRSGFVAAEAAVSRCVIDWMPHAKTKELHRFGPKPARAPLAWKANGPSSEDVAARLSRRIRQRCQFRPRRGRGCGFPRRQGGYVTRVGGYKTCWRQVCANDTNLPGSASILNSTPRCTITIPAQAA